MDAIQRADVLIEAAELRDMWDDENVRIFDATLLMNQQQGEPDARGIYEQGHIPGAAFFDHFQFSDPNSAYYLMVPDQAFLEKAIGEAGINNDSEVILYSTGMIIWATRAWWLLKYAGLDRVRVLNGGLEAWQEAGGNVEAGSSVYDESHFKAQLQPDYFVNAAEMQEIIKTTDTEAMHSLPKATFDQGHIPGSVCQSFMNFLEGDSKILPDSMLEQRLVQDPTSKRTITYCGGGVAATLNAIVCRLVGNPNVSVYDGSMSEWVGEGLPTEQNP